MSAVVPSEGLLALRYSLTLQGQIMIECEELAGKVIQKVRLFEDGSDGPEVSIDFADGTNFNVCLNHRVTLEAKITRDDGGQPEILKDYTTPAIPR